MLKKKLIAGSIAAVVLGLMLQVRAADDAPKTETPKTETPANADAPKGKETPMPEAPKNAPKKDEPKADAPKVAAEEKKVTTASGLTIVSVAPGDGEAKAGDIVWVHYTGKLKDGTEFDSSKDRDPLQFVIGQKGIIEGWNEGIAGMKVGEKRKLIIPAKLGYGEQGSPPKIGPNAELYFDVELVGVARVPQEKK